VASVYSCPATFCASLTRIAFLYIEWVLAWKVDNLRVLQGLSVPTPKDSKELHANEPDLTYRQLHFMRSAAPVQTYQISLCRLTSCANALDTVNQGGFLVPDDNAFST
jgi:hypothetical protein